MSRKIISYLVVSLSVIVLSLFSACGSDGGDTENPVNSTETFSGPLVDSRDGHIYQTVQIGNVVWMAENLNYVTPTSHCYEDLPENCATYGQVYQYSEAVNVCPVGWRLPTDDEADALLKNHVSSLLAEGANTTGFSAFSGGPALWAEYNHDRGWKIVISRSTKAVFLTDDEYASVRCVNDASTTANPSAYTPIQAPFVYETMVDERDGRTYKTIVIGTQTWMAENMNYAGEFDLCYEYSAETCEVYGRLYPWNEAVLACPPGWHLPSIEEFEILFDAVGGQSTAGGALKSTKWDGTDYYGFSALPAGIFVMADGHFDYLRQYTAFWTVSEPDSVIRYTRSDPNRWDMDPVNVKDQYAYYVSMGIPNVMNTNSFISVKIDSTTKSGSFSISVRCIKDSNTGENLTELDVNKDDAEPSSSAADESPKIIYDKRDGQTYKTVKIGSQTWMAENLNYNYVDSDPYKSGAYTYCYANDSSNCTKYGRLYTWYAAKKACPQGWHLPSTEEFKTLLYAVGGDVSGEVISLSNPYSTGIRGRYAGNVLKSTTGWKDGGNGTDAYGFSALPAGMRDLGGYFIGEGSNTRFWSATEVYSDFNNHYVFTAYHMYLDAAPPDYLTNGGEDALLQENGNAFSGRSDEGEAYSVRCIMD